MYIVSIRGDVIAMKSLNEEKATLLFVNNEVYKEHMLFEITYMLLYVCMFFSWIKNTKTILQHNYIYNGIGIHI